MSRMGNRDPRAAAFLGVVPVAVLEERFTVAGGTFGAQGLVHSPYTMWCEHATRPGVRGQVPMTYSALHPIG